MNGIEKLNLQELRSILVDLKLYKDMTHKLGERGKKLFHALKDNTSTYVIEYFPTLSEADVYSSASQVYKKVFSVEPKKEDIVFRKKESLGGGMRIYADDQVVDMSFRKVERLLKK